jgi:GNAT superfamily N-acetyltransferase
MSITEAQLRQLQRHCAEGFELWYRAAPEHGTRVDHVADATVFRWPAAPLSLFNRAIRLGDEREPEEADIERVIDLYREIGFPGYIQVSPLADQAALGRRLEGRGLTQRPSMATLALTQDRWQAMRSDPAITIEPIDDENIADFVRILLTSFGMSSDYEGFLRATMALPEVQNFLARYEGEPAGSGQIVVAADVGGLYSGGVLEEFRGRGIQSALIDYRVRVAFDEGLTLLYSGTEEVESQSSRNLRKQGFFIAYELVNWEIPLEGD